MVSYIIYVHKILFRIRIKYKDNLIKNVPIGPILQVKIIEIGFVCFHLNLLMPTLFFLILC